MAKILVVEDDTLSLKSLSYFLQEEGYEVEQARDGSQALQKVDRSFDLVLSDIGMPVIDGLDLTQRMRCSLPAIPIILMTGCGTSDQPTTMATRVGARYLLTKPLILDDLLQKIRTVLD